MPGNLSAQALTDLVAIVRRSAREWGRDTARRTAERLLAGCRSVEDGTAIGHERRDVRTQRRVLFLVEAPWVIAYGPDTRRVLRVLHGARDFPAVFPTEADHGRQSNLSAGFRPATRRVSRLAGD